MKIVGGVALNYMIANKPTHLLFTWQNDNEVLFSLLENMGIGEARSIYDYHKMFNGKSAVVFVFFDDFDIREYQLLEVATRFMKGEYIRYDVDLRNLTTIKTLGVNRVNPRQ